MFLRVSLPIRSAALVLFLCIVMRGDYAPAQVSVVTEHNDIARTGQNVQETVLTPANVNPTQFGKLFSQSVAGETFTQPLYVPQVTLANNIGTHNVVYVSTYD